MPESDYSTTPQTSPPVEESEHQVATPEESRQELREAIRGSNQVLATATTTLTFFRIR